MDERDRIIIGVRMRLSKALQEHVKPEFTTLSDDALVRAVFKSYVEGRARDDYRAPD